MLRTRRRPRGSSAAAMLALIDRGDMSEAHPAYWAPFIVVGEGKS